MSCTRLSRSAQTASNTFAVPAVGDIRQKVSALNYSYRDVIDLLAQSQMTITPTINIQGGAFALVAARTPEVLDEPRFKNLFSAGRGAKHTRQCRSNPASERSSRA